MNRIDYRPINEWAQDDRPREKLLKKGSETLSDAEIIAILIGSGSRNESAVDLAKRILHASDNNLLELGRKSISDLVKFRGVGEAKAISIIAGLQLGKRYKESMAKNYNSVRCSCEAYNIFQRYITDDHCEQFVVMFLNRANRIIKVVNVSKGGMSATVVDVKVIFSMALECKATGIMLCHNHPSGNLQPSQDDIAITKKMIDAGKMLDIMVIDHIIIADNNYFSFMDQGMLR